MYEPQPMLPAETVAKLIDELVIEHGGIGNVAAIAGVWDRTLYRVRHGECAYVSFDLADRLVTNCCGAHRWYTDPQLRRLYEHLDDLPKRSCVPVGRRPSETVECACGCGRTFDSNEGRRTYFDRACANRHWHVKQRERVSA